jgi:hypothetical protein
MLLQKKFQLLKNVHKKENVFSWIFLWQSKIGYCPNASTRRSRYCMITSLEHQKKLSAFLLSPSFDIKVCEEKIPSST